MLKHNGWIENGESSFIHHKAQTQKDARDMLNKLGLLLSRSISINIEGKLP